MTPEYHLLFQNNFGDYTVSVKFKNFAGKIPNKKAAIEEIQNIIRYSEMTFDEWPFKIEKYEIFPGRKKMVIHAEK